MANKTLTQRIKEGAVALGTALVFLTGCATTGTLAKEQAEQAEQYFVELCLYNIFEDMYSFPERITSKMCKEYLRDGTKCLAEYYSIYPDSHHISNSRDKSIQELFNLTERCYAIVNSNFLRELRKNKL